MTHRIRLFVVLVMGGGVLAGGYPCPAAAAISAEGSGVSRLIDTLYALPPSQELVVTPAFDALATTDDGVNFVVSDGDQEINIARFPDSNIERRGILEFDISSIPSGSIIESALLELDIVVVTSGDTTFPVLELHGYPGNGVVDLADATVPLNLIGLGDPILDVVPITISLDANYIETLLASSTFLGLSVRAGVDNRQVELATIETIFNIPPTLRVTHRIPEPATLVLLGLGRVFLVRRGNLCRKASRVRPSLEE